MPDDGYLDTAEESLNLIDPGPGRAVVLVYDARLGQEPRLVKVAVSVASLALQHSRLQAEVNEQLDQVRASTVRNPEFRTRLLF